MHRSRALGLLLALLVGCPGGSSGPPAPFENRYPADTSLPPGVEYPCAFTPLPLVLEGVPAGERNYVNHSCALVVGLIRAKQVLLDAMAEGRSFASESEAYAAANAAALEGLRAEPVPEGLEGFHADLLVAVELHRGFFAEATSQMSGGASMEQIHAIPSGREASQRLLAAWGKWQSRYPQLAPAVKDSMYHHLCALDLF